MTQEMNILGAGNPKRYNIDCLNAWFSAHHGSPEDGVMEQHHTYGDEHFVFTKKCFNTAMREVHDQSELNLSGGITWDEFMQLREEKLRRRAFAA